MRKGERQSQEACPNIALEKVDIGFQKADRTG